MTDMEEKKRRVCLSFFSTLGSEGRAKLRATMDGYGGEEELCGLCFAANREGVRLTPLFDTLFVEGVFSSRRFPFDGDAAAYLRSSDSGTIRQNEARMVFARLLVTLLDEYDTPDTPDKGE